MLKLVQFNILQQHVLTMTRRHFIIFLIGFVLISLSETRLYSNNIGVYAFRRNSGWNFLDRMNFDSGLIDLNLNLKITSKDFRVGTQYRLQVVAVPDAFWPKQVVAKCDMNKYSPEEYQQKQKQQTTFQVHLTNQNNYSFQMSKVININQSTTFHFIVRDCQQTVLKDGLGRDSKIVIELDMRNNGSHNSSTQSLYGWLLPSIIILEIVTLILLKRDQQQDGDNWVKWLLKISLWIGISSILLKYIGYVIYSWGTGSDYQFFDFMYLLLHSSSDSVIIVLLMLLGYGWTVTFRNARDFDLYVPLACMLGLVNIIMTVLNKVTDGQHDKYHMYDTIPAFIMIFFRLLGFAIFIFGVIRSLIRLKTTDQKFRKYFIQLTLLGTIYLTFIPVGFYVVKLVDAIYRKQAMFLGIEIIRFSLNIWLALISGWNKSTYRSIIGGSFMEKDNKYL